MNPALILIGGPSGSGKTCIAHELANALGGCVHLRIDDYYRDLGHVSADERAATNFDHPDALDWALLLEHVDALKAGHAVECPRYDFATHTRRVETVALTPAPHVVLDGIHALFRDELLNAATVSVFVDVSSEVCFARRRDRDLAERGRTEESVRTQFDTHVWPMAEAFVLPSLVKADIVLDGCGDLAESVAIILEQIAGRS
jgi:uridine kinase